LTATLLHLQSAGDDRAGRALKAETYRDDEIWHLRGNPLREDGLLGEPIFETARNVFARAIAVHEYGDIWFANSGPDRRHASSIPAPSRTRKIARPFLDTWRDPVSAATATSDRLLTHGAKYQPAQGHQRRGAAARNRGRCRYRRFRPVELSAAPRRPPQALDQQQHRAAGRRIRHLLPGAARDRDRAGAERDLLLDNDDNSLFVEFNFAGLLRGDLKTRYAAYLIGRQGEWLSANDILRMENMSPRTDPGGDEYKNPLTKDAGAGDGRRRRQRPGQIETGQEDPETMAKEKRAKLRQVVGQITRSTLRRARAVGHGPIAWRARSRASSSAAARPNVPTQPSKIALISVSGPLTPRGSWFGSSLSGIAAQATRAPR
jgi:hypothetical protein